MRRLRDTGREAVRCERAGKTIHANKPAAVLAMKALYRHKAATDLNVYVCGDHWHVGHSKVKLNRRIRQALRRHR